LIEVEGLAGLVREPSRLGQLEGIRVGQKVVDVKLLQFADDTLFFYDSLVEKKYLIAVI